MSITMPAEVLREEIALLIRSWCNEPSFLASGQAADGILAGPIADLVRERGEDLKMIVTLTERAKKAECERDDARALLAEEGKRIVIAQDAARKFAAELAELESERDEAAGLLERVVADIEDYERVNNLAPNPGRSTCWDSIAQARAVLAKIKEGRVK